MTHWSSWLLADDLGVSSASVVEVRKKYGLQPWRSETSKFSTDPLETKIRDMVGLYLAPPESAIVLIEKSQIKALDRTQERRRRR